MATRTVTSEESGTVTAVGNKGTVTGVYSGTSPTTVPDRNAQIAATLEARRIREDADESAASLMDTALQGNTIFPGQHVGGWVYFQRKKFEVGIVMLRVIRKVKSTPRAIDYLFVTAPAK